MHTVPYERQTFRQYKIIRKNNETFLSVHNTKGI